MKRLNPTTRFFNDHSPNPPRLALCLNHATLLDLPEWSSWPKAQGADLYAKLREAGFEGIQVGDPELCREFGMFSAAMARVLKPTEADHVVGEIAEAGHTMATLHAGTGLESEEAAADLARAIVAASERHALPVFIETHRATATQDMWRTVQLVRRVPEIRINGDFSHYYTGQEMRYGDFEGKLEFLEPVFSRCGFLHGRIGNTCCMQVDVGDGRSPTSNDPGRIDFVSDFRQIWLHAMRAFLSAAAPGDVLVFAPELLGRNYARKFTQGDGKAVEECDRYHQALVLCQIARETFAQAAASLHASTGKLTNQRA